ncbi:DUF5302 family protein [Actinokineospora bangkokensis]|uniref:Uncharacterized protein n=1 Tax=Actinokineospora bangkokensis TaxID=1193682 RepID=A0A1Q9LQR8_9PSEU|nr:DUF5302 family protein [Actinokineospora bangkokensis]OLR94344.1 hypothetical protein BJP25_11290 [Actinokineospora bangkokensis]
MSAFSTTCSVEATLAANKSRTASLDDIRDRFSQALAQKNRGSHPRESHVDNQVRGGSSTVPVPRKHQLRRKTG